MLLLISILLFINKLINILLKNNSTFSDINNKIDNKINDYYNNFGLILTDKNNNKFELNKTFLEWLVGFTDAEGNFLITLRDNPNFRINTLLKKKEIKVSNILNM